MRRERVLRIDQIKFDTRGEVRVSEVFTSKSVMAGVIEFRDDSRRKNGGSRKLITHEGNQVVCFVVRGEGRLYVGRKRYRLNKGIVAIIPPKVGHDFVADKGQKLVMFYVSTRAD